MFTRVPIFIIMLLLASTGFMNRAVGQSASLIRPYADSLCGSCADWNTPQKPFPTNKWRELWKSSGPNFKNWEQQFFETKLDSLQYFEKLKIEDLNELTESDFYSEKYKSEILKNLKKVKPIAYI